MSFPVSAANDHQIGTFGKGFFLSHCSCWFLFKLKGEISVRFWWGGWCLNLIHTIIPLYLPTWSYMNVWFLWFSSRWISQSHGWYGLSIEALFQQLPSSPMAPSLALEIFSITCGSSGEGWTNGNPVWCGEVAQSLKSPEDERLEHVQKWRFGSDHFPWTKWVMAVGSSR